MRNRRHGIQSCVSGWVLLAFAIAAAAFVFPAVAEDRGPVASDAGMDSSNSRTVPDTFVIDKISELYGPVLFPHGRHASMAGMAGGCTACHHQERSGVPQPCDACHGEATPASNLRQPSLRGAYHRQCLSCHRDWSGGMNCEQCHAKRVLGEPVEPAPDPSDGAGALHPNVQAPEKKIYPTPGVEEGPMVTFNHREHVEVFGKRCVDCHVNEHCGRCHDPRGNTPKPVRDDPHQDCTNCHAVADDCSVCHAKAESPGFDHAKRTGFAMKPYHQDVACRGCHTDASSYKGLKRQCTSCHAPNWAPTEFEHAKSGTLALDERHEGMDCSGCHPNGMGSPVTCTACHKKKFTYPRKSPGTRLGTSPLVPQP